MTSSERDHEFESYLKRRARFDRRLRSLDRLEPPAELDRIVIGYARQAIQGAPPVPMFRAPRWALPMGMAATILLSLSILLDMGMKGAMLRDAGSISRTTAGAAPAEWVMDMSQREADASSVPAPESALESQSAAVPAPESASASQSASGAVPEVGAGRLGGWPAIRASVPQDGATDRRATPRNGRRPSSGTASSNTARVASDPSSAVSRSDEARNRFLGRLEATNQLRTARGPSGSGSAEPLEASSSAADGMEIVTVIGTRMRRSPM